MILFKKEKEVIKLIEKHADKVEECLSMAVKTIGTYLENNISEAKKLARQTDHLETEADMVRHEIRDKLYLGAYMPLLREDIYKLVEILDVVANSAEKCADFFLNQRPLIPDDFKPDFLKITEVSMGVGESLKYAVLCYLKGVCPIEVSRNHARDIGLLESKVDSLEWDLTKKIFTYDMDFSHKIHLRRCLDHIVIVSDRAEEAAGQLDLVTLKSMI
jgi:predicted phosphate transport protein (TIGR00153 family)